MTVRKRTLIKILLIFMPDQITANNSLIIPNNFWPEPVNINWEQTSVHEHPIHGGYAIEHRRSLPDSPPINYSNSSPNSQSDHGHSHESVHVSEGFEPISVSFPDFPIHQQ
jgi:hypothetical protein